MSDCCSLVQLGDKILDRHILTEYFACDLAVCKGVCCKAGSSGAPITQKEVLTIEENFEAIAKELATVNNARLIEHGICYHDGEEWVTTLLENQACAFTAEQQGSYLCAIEIAERKGSCAQNCKPISCSLYPIRVKQSGVFTLLRYDMWDICLPAVENGRRRGIHVYEFLREPLIRAFGQEFYTELKEVGEQLNMQE